MSVPQVSHRYSLYQHEGINIQPLNSHLQDARRARARVDSSERLASTGEAASCVIQPRWVPHLHVAVSGCSCSNENPGASTLGRKQVRRMRLPFLRRLLRRPLAASASSVMPPSVSCERVRLRCVNACPFDSGVSPMAEARRSGVLCADSIGLPLRIGVDVRESPLL